MPKSPLESEKYDPDQFRMSIGDHLDELRRRLILGLIGFAVALGVSLLYGREVMSIICRPLIDTLHRYDINPMMYFTDVSDPFMVYLKVSMIAATLVASPWLLWQLWQFVASGLFAEERRMITRFIPLSLSLLFSSVAFVYLLVLPWTLQFFIAFSISIPLPEEFNPVPANNTAVVVPGAARSVEAIDGDPANPQKFQIWFDTTQQRLKFFYDDKVRVIQFGPSNLTAPMITLPDYVDLVLGMLVVFGASSQLPLVIMALAFAGIINVSQLKRARKIVYFVMSIVAAVITPGDVITATVALMVPLCLLFELGIFLAARGGRAKVAVDGADTTEGS